ncbi:amidohydrolase family protein [bacterium]|nr:amidohydrolase family protein [bacterium]
MKLLWNPVGSRLVSKLLTWLGRLSNTRKFERVAAFAGIGSQASQEDVFNILQGYYPSDTQFVVLPVDFSYMGAGNPKQPYLDQLGELRQLKRDPVVGPRIHPFVGIDPRREGFLQLAKTYIERHEFAGIKLYPPLGFSPLDERLTPLWEWSEAKQVPIMVHCSSGGVYFRGKISDVIWPDKTAIHPRFSRSNDVWTDHLSDPAGYRSILRQYPSLKICLAHMGGHEACQAWLSEPWPNHLSQSNWLTVILGLIKEFPNVYTDISYVGFQVAVHPVIHALVRDPVIGKRILFGSDYYMVHQDVTEREFSLRIRSLLSEEEFRLISLTNPQQYLKKA